MAGLLVTSKFKTKRNEKPDFAAQLQNPYRRAIRAMRPGLILVGLLSAMVNLLMLTGPIYMVQVYDRVLPSGSVSILIQLFLIVVVLFICLGVFELLRSRLLSRASFRLDEGLRGKICNFWLLSAIDRASFPNNPLRDLEITRSFISGPAILGLFDLPWMPIFLFAVFWIHPWLGVLTVLGAGIVVVAALLNRTLTRASIADAAQSDEVERSFLQRTWRNAEMVLGLGMKQNVVGHWAKLRATSLSHTRAGGETSEYFSAFSKAFRLLLQSALLTVGAYLAILQEISLGAIIAASILAGRALAPLDQVIGQWRAIGRAAEAHKRLCATLDGYSEPPATSDPGMPEASIAVKNISKSAPENGPQSSRPCILDQIAFSLRPGDALAVMGKSGAGKSSLARLLVGVWQPDKGDIRMGGRPVGMWQGAGHHIGYLPQRVEMLPGTIAQNISGFQPDALDEDIVNVARVAGMHELIEQMPEGYATQIGTPAHPLSGGQIQGLGLARALFGAPKLVVLDEPNSNLDSDGNDALVQAIRTLRARGSVVVIMAHRPNVIEAANKVLLLHEGRMVRIGDKVEVLGGGHTRKVASARLKTRGAGAAKPRSLQSVDAKFE